MDTSNGNSFFTCGTGMDDRKIQTLPWLFRVHLPVRRDAPWPW